MPTLGVSSRGVTKTIQTDDQFCTEVVRTMFDDGRSLRDTATALTSMGYMSKSGIHLTESHISNFCQELGLKRISVDYAKRHYGTWNHETTRMAQQLGVWDIKLKIDALDKDGINPSQFLSNTHWERLSQWPIMCEKFHRYILHLATT